MRIYTRSGDDGTTGLYFGGRVAKSDEVMWVNGTVDEAQAALGLARAFCDVASPLHEILLVLQRDLWILMAEVATSPANRAKLRPGETLVTAAMVARVEETIDELSAQVVMPREFVLPGENPLAAALDVARTVVRRAERLAVQSSPAESVVVAYLNRLSDLVWTMARWAEGDGARRVRTAGGADS